MTRWKSILATMALLAGVGLSGGCASWNNTQRGAAAGAAVGTAFGAAIGSDSGNTGKGAAIGAGLGTVIGAAFGNAADNEERAIKAEAEAAAAPVRGPLSLEEIVQMSKAGVGEPLIVNQIRTSGTTYNLNADTIIWLQQNNVSQGVISAMQTSGRYQAAPPPTRTVIVREPVYYGRPVFVAPPPPPPGINIGFGYYKRR